MPTENCTTTDRHGRWTVEFHELRDIQQHPAVRNLDRGTLSTVIRLWLKISTPGATVIEREGRVLSQNSSICEFNPAAGMTYPASE